MCQDFETQIERLHFMQNIEPEQGMKQEVKNASQKQLLGFNVG